MTWALVAAKDLRVEARGRETLVPILLLGFLVVTVGLLAFHDVEERHAVAAGTLWLSLAFASGVGMARAFGAEKDRGTLDVLLTLPVDRGHIYLGKTVATFVTLLVVALVTVPAYTLVSGEGLPPPGLALLVVLGSLGLAATGTMLSALTAHTRARDALLPVLLFPLLIPLLLATVHGTMDVLAGEPFAEWRPELMLLVGYDVSFLAASWLLFEQAVGE